MAEIVLSKESIITNTLFNGVKFLVESGPPTFVHCTSHECEFDGGGASPAVTAFDCLFEECRGVVVGIGEYLAMLGCSESALEL